MTPPPSQRARRVEIAEETRALDTLEGPNYAVCFQVRPIDAEARTPEQWARTVLEGVPPAVRWYLVFGWRFGLGLRLGPQPSPSHVLGWKIVRSTPDAIILEVQSSLLTAHNVLQVKDTRVLLTTFVRYERRSAAAVWSVAAPLHQRTVPYLLNHAAATDPG